MANDSDNSDEFISRNDDTQYIIYNGVRFLDEDNRFVRLVNTFGASMEYFHLMEYEDTNQFFCLEIEELMKSFKPYVK